MTIHEEAFPGPPPWDLRIMIVGDSITHGGEADYTWRYQIWKWFQSTNLKPRFVGPFIGTQENGPVLPPQPPDVPGESRPIDDTGPRTNGGYALDCEDEFTGGKGPGQIGENGGCRHYSMWGRQAAQAKGTIREMVEKYQPNLLLVLLGFNDVGWFVSDANGTIESLKEFVSEARKANPNVHFALGNIVNRTYMHGREDLISNTKNFNAMLKEQCPQWCNDHSLVAEVDVASNYSCGPHVPDLASYDGLHPNARGDIEIAYSFSLTLHNFFKLGSAPMSLPSPDEIPKRDLSPPKNIIAKGSPSGVTVTWDHVYGGQYTIRNRVRHTTDWGMENALGPRFDTTFTSAGTEWEYQVRTTHGNTFGDWSDSVFAVAERNTAPAPTNIKIYPLPQGFRITFDPPPLHKPNGEKWKIDRWVVRYFDRDWPGAFICAYGARGEKEVVFDHMHESVGHRHMMWMATWTVPEGGGEFRGCRPVLVGGDRPDKVKGVRVEREGERAVKVKWVDEEKKAAGYLVYSRKRGEGEQGRKEGGWNGDEGVVQGSEKTVILEEGEKRDEREWWVVAINGELESERSEVVHL